MSSPNFLSVADELEALLKESKDDPTAPQIDESYMIAARPTSFFGIGRASFQQWPENEPLEKQHEADEKDRHIPELVKSIVEYAVRAAPPHATAKNIGEAIGEGVAEAVNQFKLDDEKVINALDGFLREMSGAVRSRLRMG
ncbi:MAG: hypothetical protein AB7L09_00190 [Nitrospira sp.]